MKINPNRPFCQVASLHKDEETKTIQSMFTLKIYALGKGHLKIFSGHRIVRSLILNRKNKLDGGETHEHKITFS
jgi:hypothetical protein